VRPCHVDDDESVQCGPDAAVLIASGEIDYGASPHLRERIVGHIGRAAGTSCSTSQQ
jgi:hypothetical protein